MRTPVLSALCALTISHCSPSSPERSGAPFEDEGGQVADAAFWDTTPDAALLVDAGAEKGGPDAAERGWEGPFGPPAVPNPSAGPPGRATQHGDTAASDTTPLPGPGRNAVTAKHVDIAAVCPSVLIGTNGLPVAVCTQIANQTPAVYVLDPSTGEPLAARELAKGDLFGGVYPYLDHEDRLVVVDGSHHLLHLRPQETGAGWELRVDDSFDLRAAITERCGTSDCDGVVGLVPGHDERIWFATELGTVGVVDRKERTVRTVALDPGERVGNSIASAPEGAAVVTDHALYMLELATDGAPRVLWRSPYDRGSARKPGQLTQGSGSTPTFFGPRTGSEYLAITDNARPFMHLLVFRSRGPGDPLCAIEVPGPAGQGSENSPIGAGRSVILAGTYGYPYPALPDGAGPSVPASAKLVGGMTRIDIAEDERSCAVKWSNEVLSAAVPKLSTQDELVYTITRGTWLGDGEPTPLDRYAYAVIDPREGRVLAEHTLTITDTMQLAGNIGPDQVFWQGTFSGVVRIAPAP